MRFERLFRPSNTIGSGVRCSQDGLDVGATPLLEGTEAAGATTWRPRPLAKLDCELGDSYGVAVALAAKPPRLTAIAGALNRGDLALAQIGALPLELPDPPAVAKSERPSSDVDELTRTLEASGLLAEAWDPAKHPRWPAKSPDGVGGEFAPRDAVDGASDADASVIQAQIAVPAPPIEIPAPFPIPFPSEIVPPPILPPGIVPRELPRNPYPDRPECVKEWADAKEYCQGLKKRGLLGVGDYRGMGRTLDQCIRGQVSASCGGNSLNA